LIELGQTPNDSNVGDRDRHDLLKKKQAKGRFISSLKYRIPRPALSLIRRGAEWLLEPTMSEAY